jgi:hypothetical protein
MVSLEKPVWARGNSGNTRRGPGGRYFRIAVREDLNIVPWGPWIGPWIDLVLDGHCTLYMVDLVFFRLF